MYTTNRSLLPTTVGFDKVLSTLNEVESLLSNKPKQTYPPYNIYRLRDEKDITTIIEIAVAGFSKEQLEVKLEDNWINVLGKPISDKDSGEHEQKDYIHRGLSERSFEHKFKISEFVVVTDVELKNGILMITLEDITPKECKTKTFLIK